MSGISKIVTVGAAGVGGLMITPQNEQNGVISVSGNDLHEGRIGEIEVLEVKSNQDKKPSVRHQVRY